MGCFTSRISKGESAAMRPVRILTNIPLNIKILEWAAFKLETQELVFYLMTTQPFESFQAKSKTINLELQELFLQASGFEHVALKIQTDMWKLLKKSFELHYDSKSLTGLLEKLSPIKTKNQMNLNKSSIPDSKDLEIVICSNLLTRFLMDSGLSQTLSYNIAMQILEDHKLNFVEYQRLINEIANIKDQQDHLVSKCLELLVMILKKTVRENVIQIFNKTIGHWQDMITVSALYMSNEATIISSNGSSFFGELQVSNEWLTQFKNKCANVGHLQNKL